MLYPTELRDHAQRHITASAPSAKIIDRMDLPAGIHCEKAI